MIICNVPATVWLSCAPRVSGCQWFKLKIGTSSKRYGFGIAGICASNPKGGGILAMPAMVQRVLNLKEQWEHLNPSACRAFLTGWLSSVHQVPMDVEYLQWKSMPQRELSWPKHWTHLNRSACGGQLHIIRDVSLCIHMHVALQMFASAGISWESTTISHQK